MRELDLKVGGYVFTDEELKRFFTWFLSSGFDYRVRMCWGHWIPALRFK